MPRSIVAAGLALVLMVVGAVAPWAKVLGVVTIDGTTGGRDGWVVIGAAALAFVFLLIVALTKLRWFALASVLAGAAAAATAAYDIQDINSLYNGAVASAQWGIYLALAGSVLLILASIWVIAEVRRPPKIVAEAPTDPVETAPPAA